MPMRQSTISNQFSVTESQGHSGVYLQKCDTSWKWPTIFSPEISAFEGHPVGFEIKIGESLGRFGFI